MAKYVDGFVIVAPKDKAEAYKEMAQLGKKIWMKHGALDYKECRGDDLSPSMEHPDPEHPKMEQRPFGALTGAGPNEDVWFSFIVFNSRAHRDEVNAKVMSDPEMSPEKMKDQEMPFDMKRFSYGGFTVEVDGL